MNWSKYQNNIFDAGLNSNANIAVSATAGSAKTTTIIELANRITKKYPYKRKLFLAFNKSIVAELQTRLPESVDCFTIHSLGMRSLIKHYKTNLLVNEYKSFIFSNEIVKKLNLDEKEKIIYKYTLFDIVNLTRMTMIEPTEENIIALINQYDITTTNGEIEHSIELYNTYKAYNDKLSEQQNIVDFTDMVHIPASSDKIQLKQYDIIFIDELQDLNLAQHTFIEKLVRFGGRIIGVGDPKQAIYAFAGADSNSFERFAQRANTIKLPLSVCYRCAKSIVRNAKTVFSDIEEYDQQQEGIVRQGEIEELQKNDFVVCRNVRPLVNLYFDLLEEDKKAIIKGRDIEKGLIALYNKVKDFSKEDAKAILNGKLDNLLTDLQNKGITKPHEHVKYLNLQEKVFIINIISEKCKYMFEVEKKIHDLFADKKDAIILSTIHKAKGLEANRVFYLEKYKGKRLIPSPYAEQEWEKVQENNLLFVALTRAKKELVYLNY